MLEKVFKVPEFSDAVGIMAPAEKSWQALVDPEKRHAWDYSLRMFYKSPAENTLCYRRWLAPGVSGVFLFEYGGHDGWPRKFRESLSNGSGWMKSYETQGTVLSQGRFSHIEINVRADIGPFFLRRYSGATFATAISRALILLKDFTESSS